MASYPQGVRERAMKVEEVILRVASGEYTFWQAVQVLHRSPRHVRRLIQAYRQRGFPALLDGRRGRPSAKRMPYAVAEQVLGLYREKYFDFSVRHFHEKLREQHGITYSYTCIKLLLQGAGLVEKARQRGPHRRRRVRRPVVGMLLHIDGSHHRWFGDDRWYDLLVVLDDATSEVYYAQLVEEESTRTVLAALREVVEKQGRFCALYSDRGSHFWLTPQAGEMVDRQRLTQVGRALRELHIEMIPAYSPQARGRSERNFGTWQGRLPQELRLRGCTTLEEANGFLRETYIAEFNRRFRVAAAQPESAFVPCSGYDLERIFSVQQERTVNQDNTVNIAHRTLQIEKTRWRSTLAKCRVLVCEHLDGRYTVYFGPHQVGRYEADGAASCLRPTISVESGKPAPPAGFSLSTTAVPQGTANSTSGQITC
jgi:transposase